MTARGAIVSASRRTHLRQAAPQTESAPDSFHPLPALRPSATRIAADDWDLAARNMIIEA